MIELDDFEWEVLVLLLPYNVRKLTGSAVQELTEKMTA